MFLFSAILAAAFLVALHELYVLHGRLKQMKKMVDAHWQLNGELTLCIARSEDVRSGERTLQGRMAKAVALRSIYLREVGDLQDLMENGELPEWSEGSGLSAMGDHLDNFIERIGRVE